MSQQQKDEENKKKGPVVHYAYKDLPASALSSEVLSSRYASEIMKAGAEEDQDDLMHLMSEWEAHLQREGITTSTTVIETLGELTLLCHKSGKEELAGRLAGAISAISGNIVRQYTASLTTLNRLEALAEVFYEGVDELKKTNANLTKLVPRLKVAGKRKVSNAEDTLILEDANDKKDITKKKEGKERNNITKALKEVKPTDQAFPSTMDAQESATKGSKDQKPLSSSNSAEAERMDLEELQDDLEQIKNKYRVHYSNKEFSDLSQEKQVAALEYYITNILGVSSSLWEAIPWIYDMLSDLVDKERVLSTCREAQQGTLTNDHIRECVEEIEETVKYCHSAYGDIIAHEMINNGRSYLMITLEG